MLNNNESILSIDADEYNLVSPQLNTSSILVFYKMLILPKIFKFVISITAKHSIDESHGLSHSGRKKNVWYGKNKKKQKQPINLINNLI